MKRREFITLIGGAAAFAPLGAHAQQAALPLVGVLQAGSPGPSAAYVAAFQAALAGAGYVENRNVAIEYRYAEGQYDRLSQFASELVRRRPMVIVTAPNLNAARAAKAATAAIPIVFMVSDDPAKLGLVASLSRPGGNATGVNYFLSELVGKRLGLLHELLPKAERFAALVNPSAESTEGFTKDITVAASSLGIKMQLMQARDSNEIDDAFAMLAHDKVEALIVAPDTFFSTRHVQIVTLATRYAIPAVYTVRAYVENGGLMSYGPSVPDGYRQLGIYAARILKGEKPADLPVVQSTKFDFVINLPTAKALGLAIPPTLLALADEVIE